MSRTESAVAAAVLLAAVALPTRALAGPPFLTDDPEPTDTGHWEIYAPLADAAGLAHNYEGSFGVELNYGAVKDVQLTLGLPGSFAHDRSGWQVGRGDIAASLKYRFYHDEDAGIQIAAFPGITIPTARAGLGNQKVTALLPVWVQKDAGDWSVFGGGGYAINPGAGNRSYWTGGIAVTREVSKRLLLGVEADRQGPDTLDGRASTSLGVGGIFKLGGPFRLLASGGPTLTDGRRHAGFHGFAALGIDL